MSARDSSAVARMSAFGGASSSIHGSFSGNGRPKTNPR